jgi:hypothetical protein
MKTRANNHLSTLGKGTFCLKWVAARVCAPTAATCLMQIKPCGGGAVLRRTNA